MSKWKTFSIHIGLSFLIFVVGTLFLAIFSYLNILRGKVLSISQIITPILAFFIGPYRQGKTCLKRGFLEGLVIGTILLLFLLSLNFFFYHAFSIKNILYYFLLLLVSMAGGMIGISRKKEKK